MGPQHQNDVRFERLCKGALSSGAAAILAAFLAGVSGLVWGPLYRLGNACTLAALAIVPAATCGAIGAVSGGSLRGSIFGATIFAAGAALCVAQSGWRGRGISDIAWAVAGAVAFGAFCGGLGAIAGRTAAAEPGEGRRVTLSLREAAAGALLAVVAVAASAIVGWW